MRDDSSVWGCCSTDCNGMGCEVLGLEQRVVRPGGHCCWRAGARSGGDAQPPRFFLCVLTTPHPLRAPRVGTVGDDLGAWVCYRLYRVWGAEAMVGRTIFGDFETIYSETFGIRRIVHSKYIYSSKLL